MKKRFHCCIIIAIISNDSISINSTTKKIAIEYFKEAAELGYGPAFRELGHLQMKDGETAKALENYYQAWIRGVKNISQLMEGGIEEIKD